MRAEIRDLELAFKGNGHEFEAFVHDLLRAIGRTCGIASHQIEYDHRTHVPDGGRDIVVRTGSQLGSNGFIPDRPSLWSVKAGKEGIEPSQLKKEILEQEREDHPKVRKALLSGEKYVWCAVHPASQDQRDKMREAAQEIANELKFAADLIEFRWQDALTDELNAFPNIIPIRLPDVDNQWTGVRTLREWQRDPYLDTLWAEFGARAALVRRITNHLLGSGLPNVLHIAGLSGIGKSRTVLEACRTHDELRGVFYLSRVDDLSPRLGRKLQDSQRVYVVIDETPLEKIDAIASQFSEHADRVRIVTIGPATRQRYVTRNDIVVVPEPETEEDILAVIRGPGVGLSEGVLRSIAALSAHDLRLAVMLVRASLRNPDFRSIPIGDFNDVWQRLMQLFSVEITDPNAYRRDYEALSIAIDVGVEGELRQELQSLATYFNRHEEDLLRCSNVAAECGLGLRVGRFFEPTPHALAIGVFRRLFRIQLRDRLSEFMSSLPPRLLRRFLERCQECPDDVREEVAARVGGVFLEWLSHGTVSDLTHREGSRVFQAWAEFDPARGLSWLRRAVETANSEQLLALDGEPDGSGGWRGRRQLVWLCQHLACFAEYFTDCEAVLFRLAQHENENIGNNSTTVWQSLFWVVLSHTELPFPDRFQVLLKRLREATPDNIMLPLTGAFRCLISEVIGMDTPPRVIGGRIVPEQWMPKDHEQWRALRRSAGEQVLEVIGQLAPTQRGLALRELTGQLRLFRNLGLMDQVRSLFRDDWLTPDLRLSLVLELERSIDLYRRVEQEDGQPTHPQVLVQETWLGELAPKDLATRVQDATARAPHDLWDGDGPDAFYAPIADELIASSDTFRGLEQWFDSPLATAAEYLGFSLGKQDTGDSLADQVLAWLHADRCRKVTISYVNGVASRGSGLPGRWARELDTLEGHQPELAIMTTLTADISERGYQRVLNALDRMTPSVTRFLSAFAYRGWPQLLTIDQKQSILERLVRLTDGGDAAAPLVGMDLVRFWCHFAKVPLDASLVPSALELAARAPTSAQAQTEYNWRETLHLLCPHNPVRVAEIVLDIMTSPQSHPWMFGEENVSLLAQGAALAPYRIMEVVGSYILNRQRRSMFGISVYHGLFEAIGVGPVRRWVNEHGRENLRWIARHFASPTCNPEGKIVVPPLTEWLFTERENDQEAFVWFLMGRRSGARFWSGNQSAEKQAEMQPYLQHPLRRVREWAEDEIRFYANEDERFREFEDESERL